MKTYKYNCSLCSEFGSDISHEVFEHIYDEHDDDIANFVSDHIVGANEL